MNKQHHQLIVLGSGPAGCTATIYAGRANIDVAMITGMEQGGQLAKTHKIANWPGEPDEISGVELMAKMVRQAENFSPNVFFDYINKVDLSQSPFYLVGEDTEYSCNALIIATGALPRFLGLTAEQKYLGKGVSTCAVCDGFFYRNKDVIIVGGGNTAAEDALYLSQIANTVTIVHRRDALRAEEWLIKKLEKTANIKFEWNSVVEDILGDEHGVAEVKLQDVSSKENKIIKTDGVFIAIGYSPNSKLFKEQLDLEDGYIKVGYNLANETSVPGVFAAGDVIAKSYQQAIVAAGSGCIASLDAKNFLNSMAK